MKKHVLIIDDEPDVAEMVSFRLREAGYETGTALDGVQGLQSLAVGRPNIIILDICMPRMDGYAFLRELGRVTELSPIPVLVLTARERSRDHLKDYANVKACILKPFELEDLLDKVAAFMI